MKALIIIGGVAMAAFGGYQFSQVGPAPFYYDTASAEERQAWLNDEAQDIAQTVKRSLVSPSGVGPSFRLSETAIDTNRGRIRFRITVSGAGEPDPKAFLELSRRMKSAECPRFARTQLSANDIEITYSFVSPENRRLKDVSISNAYCTEYLTA